MFFVILTIIYLIVTPVAVVIRNRTIKVKLSQNNL